MRFQTLAAAALALSLGLGLALPVKAEVVIQSHVLITRPC